MGQGERHPADDRAAADGGAATLPGPGVGGGAPEQASQAAGTAATLPGVGGTAVPDAGARAGNIADGETLAASSDDGQIVRGDDARPGRIIRGGTPVADALDAPTPEHAATLQGPYTVADLPTLPRVDDTSYAIGHEIARGGMGKILAARDRRLRREVVIKVMRRESGRIDPRFEREALITARLQHPSIVRVYDAGVLGDGRAFYAMERVRGRSLEVVLAEATTLAERLALLPHAIAVCDALAYAHNEGIVHRDLKPSNILLGPFGETVVIDWGLAKDLRAAEPEGRAPTENDADVGDSSLTQHGAVMGTPAFMAPEQARGEAADERSDVYALGALLYTMFTGGPPHRGASSDEVLDAVVSGRRVRIGEAEPALPAELVTIVEHAMAHERADRYASAKVLADDLRAFAAGKLVATHSYSTWQLVRRWIGRHRVPVGIGAAATVLLAVTGVVAVRNVLHERDRAQRAERVAIEAKDRFVFREAKKAVMHDPSTAAAWLKNLTDEALGRDDVHAFATSLAEMGLARAYAGHRQDIEIVAASPDGKHAATASDDTTVRWWDLATGGSVELPGHAGPIDAMSMSPDGNYLATAGTDHMVYLWNLKTLQGTKLVGHGNTVRGVVFSPDQKHLASTAEDGTLFVWDVATGIGTEMLNYSHSLRPIVWIDNTSLFVGAFNGALGRVDITTKKATWNLVHKAELRALALTPAGDYLVIGDEDGRTTLWTPDGKRIRELTPHNDVTRDIIITADGKYVLSAGGDEDVHIHSIPDGAKRILTGHTSGIKDIEISPDNTLVGSAGIDGVVRVWRLDGTLVHTLRGHRSQVKGVVFTPTHVVSGAEDHELRIWPLAPPSSPVPRGKELREWLRQQTNVEVGDAADPAPPE